MSHWSWKHFFTDKALFKDNNFNKNAWCLKCLAYHQELLRNEDVLAVSLTGITQGRTPAELEAQARINCPPMAGKPKQNMVPHLIKCTKVDPATRALAVAAKAEGTDDLQPAQHQQTRRLSHSASWSHSLQPAASSSTTWPGNTPSVSPLPPSPLLLSPLITEPLSKRRRTSSLYEDSPLSGTSRSSWTAALQSEFGEDLCKLFIAIRAPWNSANNPQMDLFFQKWVPGSVVPDRRTLSGPILDREAAKVEDKLKLKLRGRLATFTTDGWKNKAKQSIVASMVSVASEPYLMRTHDVSADAKSGEALFKLVVEDMEWSQTMFLLIIIALCSDNGGDARKMRRLVLAFMPWLIILVCWAHQINLIVGDYLSLRVDFLTCVPKALLVIKWMNNHSRALGLFRREQMQTFNKILSLILPVITRWTAHYLSLRRLLAVEVPMKSSWMKYSQQMIECAGPKADVQQKAREIQAIVEDPQFWNWVKKTCSHLQPLAIAANITQGSNTHLDHVLTTLGNLYHIYSDPDLDIEVQDKVLSSLEKRWAAADQDPFIAAVVLNPFLRGRCLSRANSILTPIGLCNMLKRLHLRVFKEAPDSNFLSAFMDYYAGRGEFGAEAMALNEWEANAKEKDRAADPIEVWEGIDTHEQTGRNRLTKLAILILSIIANSAGCERAFSHMGLVHTAIRSKLGVDKVRKTTVVGMDIKREHIDSGLVRPRGRRNFEAPMSGDTTREAGTGDFDPGEFNEVLDFEQLAAQLIEEARDDSDSDDGEPPPTPPLTIRLPLHAIHTALPAATPQQPTVVPKTGIPLKSLFIFPTNRESPSTGMDYFWQGGIKNLDKEMEAYEILCEALESAAVEPDTAVLMASANSAPSA